MSSLSGNIVLLFSVSTLNYILNEIDDDLIMVKF